MAKLTKIELASIDRTSMFGSWISSLYVVVEDNGLRFELWKSGGDFPDGEELWDERHVGKTACEFVAAVRSLADDHEEDGFHDCLIELPSVLARYDEALAKGIKIFLDQESGN